MSEVKTSPQCQKCGAAAALQCPTCIKLKMKHTHYCGNDCFRADWKVHNELHKFERKRAAFTPPPFNYTGELRPQYVTPMRRVPNHIQKPDYHLTGQPASEMARRGDTRIHVNTPEEIKGIREACRIGRVILDIAGNMVAPGVTCEEIDAVVHEETVKRNAYPSPLNYHYFPKSCCTSVNEVICHGIPDTRPLEDGDIVNIDITVFKDGYHGDLNETFLVGNVAPEYKKLVKVTHESLAEAIEMVQPGVACREFGQAISKRVGREGYQVVKTYCGHGIGSLFHCAPNIPHYARNKAVGILRPGMCFTIEPMINMGKFKDITWPDNWTSVTTDGKRSAQFEHTILVTETGYDVLTARTEQSVPFFWEAEGYVDEEAKAAEAAEAKKAEARAAEAKEKKQALAAEGADEQKKKKKKKKKRRR